MYFRNPSLLAVILALLVTLVGCSGALYAQDATASSVAKPMLPANTEPAKAEQPPSPDTTPARVPSVPPENYVIGSEDVLTVNVWREQEVSRTVQVRPDGMITLPLVGEIKALGLTPLQLQDQVTNSLKKFMADPQVTVMVTEVRSLTFNIVGQVGRPGFYPLTRSYTVLDAIAMAGGMRDFAKEKKIYVLRTQADGKQVRLKFNYKQVIKGKHPEQNIVLQPRDTLVVP